MGEKRGEGNGKASLWYVLHFIFAFQSLCFCPVHLLCQQPVPPPQRKSSRDMDDIHVKDLK
ncbi:MAG: hypothetical protein DRN07_06560 [Thermoplasmata archaeon]|nr:MAG: hypothetical protein DRN07_06560 [Thermoplasmata archaeon]